jgi:hypothetical protein
VDVGEVDHPQGLSAISCVAGDFTLRRHGSDEAIEVLPDFGPPGRGFSGGERSGWAGCP